MAATVTFADAPAWRREPYRLFFALGLIHVWAGVSPWLLVGLGLRTVQESTPVYHSIAQIQGFLMCFAVGFLFTMVPRRTGTRAPSGTQMLIGLVSPIGATLAAAHGALAFSQLFWFSLLATLLWFVFSRFRQAPEGRGALPGFLWIPAAVGMGALGSVLFGVYGALGPDHFDVHELAKLFLLQGVFLGLILGVGTLVLPLMTRGESPGAEIGQPVHVAAIAVLVASFFVETYVHRPLGYVLRGGLALALLLLAARIYRLPRPALGNRFLVWGSAWMLPLGYFLAALGADHQRQAGLHLVFIGGFATMAFAVASHVALAHGGRKPEVQRWSFTVTGYGLSFLLAAAFRVLLDFDVDRYRLWLGLGAGAFLFGTLLWAALVLPVLWRRGS